MGLGQGLEVAQFWRSQAVALRDMDLVLPDGLELWTREQGRLRRWGWGPEPSVSGTPRKEQQIRSCLMLSFKHPNTCVFMLESIYASLHVCMSVWLLTALSM